MRYKTILIDLPWELPFVPVEIRKGMKKVNYSSMSIKEIEEFPINNFADNDCVMFFWTTHKHLPVSFQIINKWKFKYLATISWDKGNGMTWNGIQKKTEFCLICYKGKLTLNFKKPIPTHITEKSQGHSKKPHCLYRIIEKSTLFPRIELFARHRREGWDAWGNEVPKWTQKLII